MFWLFDIIKNSEVTNFGVFLGFLLPALIGILLPIINFVSGFLKAFPKTTGL